MADGRGDYRSLYVSFWDDPDTHALSDRAYRVLTTLKGTLPASGLGVVYPAQLAERCNCNVQQLERALAELEAPKRGGHRGWLVRDRNVVWIVNALRYEPALRSNNWKHRAFLRDRLLAPLGDTSPLVRAFRDHYPEWFSDTTPKGNGTVEEGNGKGNDTHTVRYPMGEDRESKHIALPVLTSPNQAVVGSSAERAEPTTTTESALAEQLTTDGARDALERVLANVPNRGAWIADLAEQIAQASPATISEALQDFVANGEADRPHAGRFRGYVKRTRTAASAPTGNGASASAPDEEETEAVRKHRLLVVETRRAQSGGDEWWERMQRESPGKRPADVYAYAYEQLKAEGVTT